ncbi:MULTISPECIES: FIST signal transduction protein [Variovorax]|uniref:FIST C-terminal domain-containing protein n=1 Tax=Variovorax ginsengisoli TaxID=363844 RepID=A0ABT8RZS8_9BURK|nr:MULTISPECIES: FIST N-terminal domain-containing protein [Variovorax]MDM0082149.1 FIST C-terminal domain-containing protein [Variovorax sp. J31P179]MDN8612998.1 FIST C-terminal domain-containing protein [Variovorax ginsengisoli]MDO1532168.1 FIST C-terminal domain-containing protein [Variovorax ginsengisoli]
MKLFPSGHATHPQWRMAAGLVLAQLRAQMALPDYARAPSLGLLYITDHYGEDAQEILDHLGAELPEITDWTGTVGVGVAANNAEYFDEPALSVMLCELPSDQYRVFSGVAPLASSEMSGFAAHTALVHADPRTPELGELIAEMADRTDTGYLFGGLSSGRVGSLQFAIGGNGNIRGHGAVGGVFSGGLSGVVFGEGVRLVSRVTQGCQPVSREREITEADGNLLLALDGQPALDVLLADLRVSLDAPEQAIDAVRATLVGLVEAGSDGVRRTGDLGADVRVRHIIGLDPTRRGVAIADNAEAGMRLSFCRRNAQAARADLMRVCAEIREELEPQEQTLATAREVAAGEAEAAPHPARRIAGAIYVSCSGRGGPHFGAPGAELQIVRHALGDVPLVGFFAAGEIARNHLYGYTGVLTVFTAGD